LNLKDSKIKQGYTSSTPFEIYDYSACGASQP